MKIRFFPATKAGLLAVLFTVISILTTAIGLLFMFGRYRLDIGLPAFTSVLIPLAIIISVGSVIAAIISAIDALKHRKDKAILTISALILSISIIAGYAAALVFLVWVVISWFTAGGV